MREKVKGKEKEGERTKGRERESCKSRTYIRVADQHLIRIMLSLKSELLVKKKIKMVLILFKIEKG
jgi:hypothetical protein